MSGQEQPSPDHPSYALVTVRGSAARHRVSLPVKIGTSGASDVIVNVEALADHAYTLSSRDRKLCLVREPSGEMVDLSTLRHLGLAVQGPIRFVDGDKRKTTRLVVEALSNEQAWFQKLPSAARRWLGGNLPQRARLALWGLAVIGLAAFALHGKDEVTNDLSAEPLSLKFDTVRSESVGANPKNPDFAKGYENGVTFVVDLPKTAKGQTLLLSFGAAGLNIGKELALEVNGHKVFESEAEAECAQDFCDKSVRLGTKVLKTGKNKLHFAHNQVESSYFVSHLHLRTLPVLKELEAEQMQRWFELAQRSYDERGIVPENLVTAKGYVQKVSKMAGERDGPLEVPAKAKVLENDIDLAFKKVTSDLWTAYAMHEKLGKKLEMEQTLGQLLKLFPDARSDEHAGIIEKLEALKEQKP